VIWAIAVLAASAGPAPANDLAKPAAPPPGATRVRFPISGGETTVYLVKALVPKPPAGKSAAAAKPGDGTPATVGLSTQPAPGHATVKALKKLGYPAAAGATVVLPEVVLVGEATGKARPGAVYARAVNVKVMALASAYGSEDHVAGADLLVGIDALLRAAPGAAEPWVEFGDAPAFTASYPAAAVARPAGEKPADPPGKKDPPKPDAGRVPVAVVMRPGYVLPLTRLDGKPAVPAVPAHFGLAQVSPPGVWVSLKASELYRLKPVPASEFDGFYGFDRRGKAALGRAADLRFTAGTGTGLKTAREFVATDHGLILDQEQQVASVVVGPGYFKPLLQHPLLAVGSDGVPRLYGYAKKEAVPEPAKKK
jgi:hypothetical protein